MNESAIQLRVGCKINLSLRITGRRPNGYHELDSLFYPLPDPHDVLHITQAPKNTSGLQCNCATPGIDPQHNTLTRAYAAYATRTGYAPSIRIRLEKGIPHGAGLGGGSADAGALLLYLNARAPQALDTPALTDIAATVGADVPFFLQNAPCRVKGIGEKLEPLPYFLTGWHIVVLCPPVQVSTPWAYQAWDVANLTKIDSLCLTSSPLKAKEFVFQRSFITNTFESVVFTAHPVLRMHKEALLKAGAHAAVLSGSGASLVGLFRDASTAQRAASHMQRQGLQIYRLAL
ncbi:MAG: 4-(cytidine 5'-diphospho)-2-C-methyl-D-erythritol kinase [Desulfovibrionaceae bacterium]